MHSSDGLNRYITGGRIISMNSLDMHVFLDSPLAGIYPGPRLHLFPRDPGKDAVQGPEKTVRGT